MTRGLPRGTRETVVEGSGPRSRRNPLDRPLLRDDTSVAAGPTPREAHRSPKRRRMPATSRIEIEAKCVVSRSVGRPWAGASGPAFESCLARATSAL
jgi:hypothetical protein